MALAPEQKAFFQGNGYLPYTRVLSDEEVNALRQRCEDIVCGRVDHVPPQYIQLEAAFRDGRNWPHPSRPVSRQSASGRTLRLWS